jgi:hypothetical protein
MESSATPNPVASLLSFWMLLQLAATMALLLGGLYALYCISRVASSLDRLASAMESWAAQRVSPSEASAPPSSSFPLVPPTTPPYSPPGYTPVTPVQEENRL